MIEVIKPGFQTTIQDLHGRKGYWGVGIPPSGAIDNRSFGLANACLGNHENATGLEMTISGAHLKFGKDTCIAITGAETDVTLAGKKIERYKAIKVKKGDLLKIGNVKNTGMRIYLAVKGGLNVKKYLGSTATFVSGNFGGMHGRALKAGDRLMSDAYKGTAAELPGMENISVDFFSNDWKLKAMVGPHASPDYFTEEMVNVFFSETWRVHYQSNRLGFRLLGAKAEFARTTGGDGGSHPSNLHDYVYTIGSINFTGNMPIILGPDGPSLGGFVCLATVISSELWKLGQLRPNDTIVFQKVSHKQALESCYNSKGCDLI